MQALSLDWEAPLEHGNPLQYSCLENPMDRGAWQAVVHAFAKSQVQLNMRVLNGKLLCKADNNNT